MSLDVPMDMNNNVEIRRKVIALLPTLSRACRLCEIFLEFGEYLYALHPFVECCVFTP